MNEFNRKKTGKGRGTEDGSETQSDCEVRFEL